VERLLLLFSSVTESEYAYIESTVGVVESQSFL
jgi:hypothetical protein